MFFANTPEPPYYACIFTSKRIEGDAAAYDLTAELMDELAAQQEGYLGIESVRDQNGLGITVSYWKSLNSIKHWKEHALHKKAQEKGMKDWYSSYYTRICKVEREYHNK
ncbi:antibiotic biosynthesis monooxygenase family protein [Peribacillus muralis]|uniref:antibiotic biosynthesis monooxygenase family protein n=1 Tax=Peribacillus muralis TaxID=264697 RepID=UPI00070A36C8|nr:antibiotic biosynthesis monooxygenase [Peribacillus muralis]